MFRKQQGIEFIQLMSKSGINRRFTKVKYLGSGGFARCYEVIEQKNYPTQHEKSYKPKQNQQKKMNQKSYFAFKIIKKSTLFSSPELIHRLKTQIRLHKKFVNRSYIVNFIQSFQTKQYIYLLLELCENQTLNQLIKRRKFLSQEQTRYFIRQLALGLKQIHQEKVIHRDIKLCNLFLSEGLTIKIGDFGLATQIQSNIKRHTICGTAHYMAPQILIQQKQKVGHSYQVDIWSLGVVCYTLFYGHYPFQDQFQDSILKRIKQKGVTFSAHSSNPNVPSCEFKDFIIKIFQINPYDRLSVNQIMIHKFLTKTAIPKQLPIRILSCALDRLNLHKIFPEKQNLQAQAIQNIAKVNKNEDAKKFQQQQPKYQNQQKFKFQYQCQQKQKQKQKIQLQQHIIFLQQNEQVAFKSDEEQPSQNVQKLMINKNNSKQSQRSNMNQDYMNFDTTKKDAPIQRYINKKYFAYSNPNQKSLSNFQNSDNFYLLEVLLNNKQIYENSDKRDIVISNNRKINLIQNNIDIDVISNREQINITLIIENNIIKTQQFINTIIIKIFRLNINNFQAQKLCFSSSILQLNKQCYQQISKNYNPPVYLYSLAAHSSLNYISRIYDLNERRALSQKNQSLNNSASGQKNNLIFQTENNLIGLEQNSLISACKRIIKIPLLKNNKTKIRQQLLILRAVVNKIKFALLC